ncbi:hypothetical protein CUJ86_06990 [Methanofollis fontis]|uniref:Uncharacterized protein n=2 Tax=Methanofollis fontis TaxID=2052832 RepID=A0A483CLP7_9EURY|nr:hypothetical protein CUJ86_06990 [Methanofollis fontis]
MNGYLKWAISLVLISAMLVGAGGAAPISPMEQWNATFNEGTFTDFFAVEGTDDGGYLLGGFGYGVEDDSAVLIRTDGSGAVEWTVRMGGDSVAALAPLDGDAYAVATYSVDGGFLSNSDPANATGLSHLSLIGPDGTTVWDQTLEGKRVTDVAALPDGSIAVTGWVWNPGNGVGAFLALYDGSGTETWTRTYDAGAARTLAPAPDGSLYIGGTLGVLDDPPCTSWIMRTDSTGNSLWTHELPDRSLFTSLHSDDGCLLSGSMSGPQDINGTTMLLTTAWAAEIDDAGDLIWETDLPGVEMNSAATLPGTGYILAGRWGDSPQVQIIDGNGAVLGGEVWDGWDGRFSAIFATQDGGAVTTGWSRMSGAVEGWAVSLAGLSPSATTPESPAPTATPGFLIISAGAAIAIAPLLHRGLRRR